VLYVTTRNNRETYTSHRALTEERAPDGGFYVPMRLPEFANNQIDALKNRSFNQCVADTLNLFFGTRLTAFDIDFSTGRCPVRLVGLRHRIWLGETWHNLEGNFDRMARNLYRHITGPEAGEPTDWFRIVLRMGVLFGFFGKLMRKETAGPKNSVDIAVLSGDFSAPMAAWYARRMGLPIANIVICCNDNNNPWELIHHGEMRTNLVAVTTETPEGDYVVPTHLERFVYGCGGVRETERFVTACREGRMYIPSDMVCEAMRKGMQASVVGQDRVRSAIPNVYRTHRQLFHPCTALVYSGLMDYRAGAGESRAVLVLSEKSPGMVTGYMAEAMGMPEPELKKILNILE